MTGTADSAPVARFPHGSVEFGRVVNLADAVFAIALTLLVLNLVVPADLSGPELAGALRDQVPQLVAFGLAFALVANVWWQHHRICAALAWFDPLMVGINVACLAGVALVPYPTSLIGTAPDSRAAALPFIGVFLALSSMWLVLIVHAHRANAWRWPMPGHVFRWIIGDWAVSISALVVAMLVTLVDPIAGLVVLAVGSGTTRLVMARLGPERSSWF